MWPLIAKLAKMALVAKTSNMKGIGGAAAKYGAGKLYEHTGEETPKGEEKGSGGGGPFSGSLLQNKPNLMPWNLPQSVPQTLIDLITKMMLFGGSGR